MPATKLHELSNAVGVNAQTFETLDYSDMGDAVRDLRDGRLNGVVDIPPGFSRRTLQRQRPARGAHRGQHRLVRQRQPRGHDVRAGRRLQPARDRGEPLSPRTSLDVVEVYPYVPYIQYLLPGSIVMSVFMMVMIGGGIIFVDDKARGLHEGYLVTPITRLELIFGFNLSGAIKAVIAGVVLMTVGSLIAGVPHPFEPARLGRLFVVIVITAFALVSMMFLLMVRVSDPLIPRATFGLLNTFLYFPSGAVYPQQAFPGWMRAIAKVDPFTYAVHALKCLLLKNTGFGAIAARFALSRRSSPRSP